MDAPRCFSFLTTVLSHGWFDLPPFHWDGESSTLGRVIRPASGRLLVLSLRAGRAQRVSVRIESRRGPVRSGERREAHLQVRHMLRLDERLSEFHALCSRLPGYGWVPRRRAGRLLRAPDPFEDLVKLICTTNCSWSLTRVMISALVGGLGEEAAAGLRAFPTPEAMAVAPPGFYRDSVRAGYRAGPLRDLALRVAAGEIAPSSWLDPRRDPGEIQKEILSIRGAGPYVAENMLKLLGRYGGLGLDSWCRRKFSEIHAGGRKVADRTIERHYARFESWRGLALWCDLTRDWLEAGSSAPGILRSQKY